MSDGGRCRLIDLHVADGVGQLDVDISSIKATLAVGNLVGELVGGTGRAGARVVAKLFNAAISNHANRGEAGPVISNLADGNRVALAVGATAFGCAVVIEHPNQRDLAGADRGWSGGSAVVTGDGLLVAGRRFADFKGYIRQAGRRGNVIWDSTAGKARVIAGAYLGSHRENG